MSDNKLRGMTYHYAEHFSNEAFLSTGGKYTLSLHSDGGAANSNERVCNLETNKYT